MAENIGNRNFGFLVIYQTTTWNTEAGTPSNLEIPVAIGHIGNLSIFQRAQHVVFRIDFTIETRV